MPKVSTAKFMFPILRRPIRVFVTGQDTIRYDPYPVARKKLTKPSSGTVPDQRCPSRLKSYRCRAAIDISVPDTAIISEHRIQSQEWSGTSWKQSPETAMESCFWNAPEFHRIRPVPVVRLWLGYMDEKKSLDQQENRPA